MHRSVAPRPAVAPAAARRLPGARLRYEAVLVGRAGFATPAIVLVSFTALGVLVGDSGRMLTTAVEAGVPLAAGLYGAGLLATEPSLELQLSSAGGFRPTALRRLAALGLWSAMLSLGAVGLGRLTGLLAAWPGTTGPLQDLLMPLAPLAAFAVFGCLLGATMRSRGGASAVVTAVWIGALVWKDAFLAQPWLRAWFPFQFTFAPHAADALTTRLTLLGITAIGLAVLVAWLGRGEWLLGSEDQ